MQEKEELNSNQNNGYKSPMYENLAKYTVDDKEYGKSIEDNGQMLDVYISGQDTYISQEDYTKYTGEAAEATDNIGEIGLVKVSQETINQICVQKGLKAQMNLMRTRENKVQDKDAEKDTPDNYNHSYIYNYDMHNKKDDKKQEGLEMEM